VLARHRAGLCMYECMYACMHVCMYVCMYACMCEREADWSPLDWKVQYLCSSSGRGSLTMWSRHTAMYCCGLPYHCVASWPARDTHAATSSDCSGTCDPGKFSSGGAASSACPGTCTAGYACPSGSTSATQVTCPAGQFSLAGAPACVTCAAGRYGATTAMPTATCSGPCDAGRYGVGGDTTASCSGPCNAGRYGSVAGQTTSACEADCLAGYACVAGSTSPTAAGCPVGSYSLAGAGTCTLCPGGQYGATAFMPSASCTGACTTGFACPAGSTNATATLCPVGRYSLAAASVCINCAAGLYGGVTGMPNASCSGLCAGGRYGSVSGLSTSACEADCLAGYACVPGSTNATAALCPPGKYSLAGAGVCTDCSPGLYGATPGMPNASCTGSPLCPHHLRRHRCELRAQRWSGPWRHLAAGV
jgi:hypothetical protein